MRAAQMKSAYGILPDEYDALLAGQGGLCAICGADRFDRRRKALGVDHDHLTGAIRGLLCRSCNLALGFLRDDPALARAALAYLIAHGQGKGA
jgi:hypothetical protein